MASLVVKSFSSQRSPQGDPAPQLPFAKVAADPSVDAGADSAVRILGAGHDLSWKAAPLSPAADTMFGPRGVCLFSTTGPLWVADTGHHRLLGWRSLPATDGQPADWIIGQSDFHQEGQNAKGDPAANTVAVPTGICACGEGMAVADAWNHRVLIWRQTPTDNHVPADVVLGQVDFVQNLPNRGGEITRRQYPALALWCVFPWGMAICGRYRQSACPGLAWYSATPRTARRSGAGAGVIYHP